MNDTVTLLSNDTSNAEKCRAANNIINIHELPLSIDQILLAFKKICEWINGVCTYSPDTKTNRIFILNKILSVNKNMYIALILALCDNYEPFDLFYFIIFTHFGIRSEPDDIGLNFDHHDVAIRNYHKLLDYYEFDVNDISTISSTDKKLIDDYRVEKYSGKSIKHAVKK